MNTIYTAFTRFAKKASDWQSQVLASLSFHTGFIPEIGPLRLPEAVFRAHNANSVHTRLFEASIRTPLGHLFSEPQLQPGGLS